MRAKKALAMAFTGIAVGAIVAIPGTASAAAPTCAEWTYFTTGTGYHVGLPSTTAGGAETNCILGVGSQGPGVFVLQDALRRCYGQKIPWDAIYGIKTRDAVKNVQRFHKFKEEDIDGEYGSQTRAAMVWPKYRDSDNKYSHCW